MITMPTASIRARVLAAVLPALLILVAAPTAHAAAKIVVLNLDGPNEGFNDPAPAAPVGGNTGTTKGQQRLIAFQRAADIWGSTVDSAVTIYVTAAFNPLGANVLGSAGATSVFSDFPGLGNGFFPGVEFPDTWYGAALADKRAGLDLDDTIADIDAEFSSDTAFYLGLDHNGGALPDLVTVVLHELGHGLNFQTFVSRTTGNNFAGQTDIYSRHLLDSRSGLHWDQMTAAERLASTVSFGKLVWDGAQVTADVPSVLVFGSPQVLVTAPAAVAGSYQFGTAAFGPGVGHPNVFATIVAAADASNAAGPSTTDACTPLTNASAVAGRIALIERGTCGFAVKARNASAAGASAVIIYNNAANAAAAAPGMADDGVNGRFVTAPTVSVARTDGLAILSQLGAGVSAKVDVDPSIRAGADAAGRARLYAPNPSVAGSSVSHYDPIASRNLLMEPAINGDLTHNLKAPYDLTLELLRDLGWYPDADSDGVPDASDCNPNSSRPATIHVDDNDSGVPDVLFSNGCTVTDLISALFAEAKNHGQFVSGVAHLTNSLVDNGVITGQQKGAIQSTAAHTK
jgi:hypothetical protein